MAGLTGLTGLTPTVVPSAVTDPGATAEEIHGGPADPVHGQWMWDQPTPWVIQSGWSLIAQPPQQPDPSMLGQIPGGLPPGSDPESYADAALTHSHNAPWPYRHIPDSGAVNSKEVTALQSEANQELHGYDAGDTREFTEHLDGGLVQKMPWDLSPDYNRQGTEEGTEVGQLTGNNHTGWDRFAGWAAGGDVTRATAPGTSYPEIGSAGGNLNRFGFDQAHIHRQNPQGTLPVPDTTMMGKQRPMVMNIPGRYGSYPVGAGSPFGGQLPGVGNDIGAAEIGVPSDYQPPPDAPANPAVQQAAAQTPAWGLGFLGI